MFATASKVGVTAGAVALLESLFDEAATRRVGFRLWNGSPWPDEYPRAATLVLNHPEALEHMLLPGTEAGLAEAYLRNDFDVEGDIEAALDLAEHLLSQSQGGVNGSRWLGAWRHLSTGANCGPSAGSCRRDSAPSTRASGIAARSAFTTTSRMIFMRSGWTAG